ncbi:hypothetical protein [Bacteriophage Eos]|nr:hypothetical protein [Bacteriophage Eos]
MQQNKQYAEREYDELDFAGGYYSRHVYAMTAEDLNAKHQIAGELGYRDMLIDQLNEKIRNLENKILEADHLVSEMQRIIDGEV